MGLDIGVLFSFRNPAFNRRPWTEVYDAEMSLIREADELGYGHVWLSEHHFVDDGYAPALLPIAGAVATQTRTVRIGTYVLLLPLHDPVAVAEAAATVDILSGGRFDLGVAQGYVPDEFDPRGIPHEQRASRMEDGLIILQGLLRGEPFSYEGRHHRVQDIRIVPPPVQSPLPIWVGATGPKALDRAARMGFHLASSLASTHEVYADALRAHGRDPSDFNVVQLANVYCADTTEQAWNDIAEPLHHMMSHYLAWAASSGDIGQDQLAAIHLPTPEEYRREQRGDFFGEPIYVGTPDHVLKGLTSLLNSSPSTHLVLQMSFPGNDVEATRHSMRLFAEHVLPHL
ncbi:hypothetical protein DI005_17615 [Prauserella sp. PE36]|uniref:LLM class flavin-dependent oxidoreductase n=1 Tax=Prauserella sp. PE36 TaxID=1504709 RepID=UPI000D842186|nr:LLM class flavin-dependent oxidoreductase [Prauserella sp. PE36]PXY23247.1 hypothetical protein BAY59_26525 [Prauserella coralliicola]RBM18844.1 hypothetical protein DI005_17615 [Prauserella sp. PE36]